MSNIYLKLVIRKTDVLKTLLKIEQNLKNFFANISSWGAPTHADIIEF